MGASDLGSPIRSVCQIVDKAGNPGRAMLTSNLWEVDSGVFSQKTDGNLLHAFTTGEDYFKDFITECKNAKEEICILGWQVNWDALLSNGLRLYDVLRAAAARNVSIYVMPWCHSNPVQTYDYQTAIVLGQINDELNLSGKDRRVHVIRASSRATVNVRYFSHHQKQVIIDQRIAYVGGMDLCYGRFDDASYDLHPDANGRQAMNRYNPCIPARQDMADPTTLLADPNLMSGLADRYARSSSLGKTSLEQEQKKIDSGAWQIPYKESSTFDTVTNSPSLDSNKAEPLTLDPSCQPRMPWQDVHCRVEGPAVSELLRNFVVRWNSSGGKRLAMPKAPSAYERKGSVHVQVLRSAPAGMVEAEAKLLGNPHKGGVAAEDHIQHTMLRLIERAHAFIYIESQFFVSAFGEPTPKPTERLSPAARFINAYYGDDQNAAARKAGFFSDNKSWIGADKKDLLAPPENGICRALVQRIRRAILDCERRPFHVYMTLPVHPEGALAKASIAVQVYWTMQSLVHGSHSLINGIRRSLKARDFLDEKKAGSVEQAVAMAEALALEELDSDDERWKDYLTLLNLRNWAQFGDARYVTEQIYVHSKLMIVDDLYALIGSANINDRSLLGTRDSEVAILAMDEANALAETGGPGRKAPVRLFAHNLRKDLWKKLFGITGGIRPARNLEAAIEAPADPKSWRAIQAQAEHNAAAYEAAFPFVPRNWFIDSRNNRDTAKIVPNWDSGMKAPKTGQLGLPSSPLPFEPEFWSAPQHNPKGVGKLDSIKGFITALPVHWLQGENVRFEFPTDLVVKNEKQQEAEDPGNTRITQAETANAGAKA